MDFYKQVYKKVASHQTLVARINLETSDQKLATKFCYAKFYNFPFSLLYFHVSKYAIGAAKNIEANVPNITQIQMVNENVLITHVPNINIATTTSIVDTDVAIDLRKESLILFSKTSP